MCVVNRGLTGFSVFGLDAEVVVVVVVVRSPLPFRPALATLQGFRLSKELKIFFFFFFKKLPPYTLWRDSISRPIAPVSTVKGGDDTIT
jgi:hypothetical protein